MPESDELFWAASCQHAAVAGLIDPKKIVRSRPCWSRTETAACDGLFLKNRSISAGRGGEVAGPGRHDRPEHPGVGVVRIELDRSCQDGCRPR